MNRPSGVSLASVSFSNFFFTRTSNGIAWNFEKQTKVNCSAISRAVSSMISNLMDRRLLYEFKLLRRDLSGEASSLPTAVSIRFLRTALKSLSISLPVANVSANWRRRTKHSESNLLLALRFKILLSVLTTLEFKTLAQSWDLCSGYI